MNEKELSSFRNSALGFIFQFHQLLPEFTACENIVASALIKGINKKEAQEQALELLINVGLEDRANHKPAELSGGEQQRVAVCRALINKPKIIFGDEPSGNLDTQSSRDLHELFFKLRDDLIKPLCSLPITKIFSAMADRALTMVDGKFV